MANWIPNRVDPCPSNYAEHATCVDDLALVAHRISECNRIRSVEAEYDNDTATAKCMALRNTHFRIILYQGETQKHIIVDMRRMSGCSLIFQEEYGAIMNAAKFGEIAPREVVPFSKSSTSDSKPCKNNDYIPLQDGVLEQSLVSAKKHLHSDFHDVRVLALEDVASTTSHGHSSDDTALNACKIIMEQKSDIGDSMASIIFDKEFIHSDDKYIRSLALTILSNALSTLSEEKSLTPLIQDKWYRESLMPSLINEIKTAEKNPCNASLAAKCLSVLFSNSAEARSQTDEDALIVLEAAKRIGHSSYANLEMEAQDAIEKMAQAEV